MHQRFAGTDAQRLASLTRAIKQKLPIVMATRGGYGLGRLLHLIDWKAIADSGKRFVGLSDFTAFNLALLAKTGAVSYTGATAVADFGGKKVDDLTEALFGEIMRGELEILSFETQDADPVDCRGILWGGNLAMVASLLGTPYMPKVRGGILFLEDVAEHPYRVERMLIQLWQAGILDKRRPSCWAASAITSWRRMTMAMTCTKSSPGCARRSRCRWSRACPTATSPPRPRCRSDRRSAWPPSRAWRTWSSTSTWGKPTPRKAHPEALRASPLRGTTADRQSRLRVVPIAARGRGYPVPIFRRPAPRRAVCRPGLLHYRVFPGASSAAPFGQLSYPRSKTP